MSECRYACRESSKREAKVPRARDFYGTPPPLLASARARTNLSTRLTGTGYRAPVSPERKFTREPDLDAGAALRSAANGGVDMPRVAKRRRKIGCCASYADPITRVAVA